MNPVKNKLTLVFIPFLAGFLIFAGFISLRTDFKMQPVYAQPDCSYDCDYGCCQTACCYDACTSCSCTCTGSPCPASIATITGAINNNYSQIETSRDNLIDLIEERVESKLRISNISEALNDSQVALSECYTPKIRYLQFEQGEEINWKSPSSCSSLKQSFNLGLPFYDEAGDVITECYGPSETTPAAADNFFCCRFITPSE